MNRARDQRWYVACGLRAAIVGAALAFAFAVGYAAGSMGIVAAADVLAMLAAVVVPVVCGAVVVVGGFGLVGAAVAPLIVSGAQSHIATAPQGRSGKEENGGTPWSQL